MYLRRYWSLIPALALVFALVACDSDSTGIEGPLSEQEVESMLEALSATGGIFMPFFFGGGFLEAHAQSERPRLARSEHEWTDEIDETLSCPISGSVHLEGEFTSTEEEGSYQDSFSVTQTHENCVASDFSEEIMWTFNGNPSLVLSGSISDVDTESGWEFEMTLSQSGGLSWQGAGHSGTCNVNVDFHFEETGTETGYSGSFSVQGQVCGHPISISEPFSETW